MQSMPGIGKDQAVPNGKQWPAVAQPGNDSYFRIRTKLLPPFPRQSKQQPECRSDDLISIEAVLRAALKQDHGRDVQEITRYQSHQGSVESRTKRGFCQHRVA